MTAPSDLTALAAASNGANATLARCLIALEERLAAVEGRGQPDAPTFERIAAAYTKQTLDLCAAQDKIAALRAKLAALVPAHDKASADLAVLTAECERLTRERDEASDIASRQYEIGRVNAIEAMGKRAEWPVVRAAIDALAQSTNARERTDRICDLRVEIEAYATTRHAAETAATMAAGKEIDDLRAKLADETQRRANAESHRDVAVAEVDSLKADLARLTQPGPASDEELRSVWCKAHRDAMSAAGQHYLALTAADRALYTLGLAHGRAEQAVLPTCRLTIEEDADGYKAICEDGVGIAKSRSTTACKRIVAALAAAEHRRESERDAVADFIYGHAKRLGEQSGADGDELMVEIHDVLNHLRADEDGEVFDGRAGAVPPPTPAVDATDGSAPILGSDADIARDIHAAVGDDMPWSVIEPEKRAAWTAAITAVVRPLLAAAATAIDDQTWAAVNATEACARWEEATGCKTPGLAKEHIDALATAIRAAESRAQQAEQERDEARRLRVETGRLLDERLAGLVGAGTPAKVAAVVEAVWNVVREIQHEESALSAEAHRLNVANGNIEQIRHNDSRAQALGYVNRKLRAALAAEKAPESDAAKLAREMREGTARFVDAPPPVSPQEYRCLTCGDNGYILGGLGADGQSQREDPCPDCKPVPTPVPSGARGEGGSGSSAPGVGHGRNGEAGCPGREAEVQRDDAELDAAALAGHVDGVDGLHTSSIAATSPTRKENRDAAPPPVPEWGEVPSDDEIADIIHDEIWLDVGGRRTSSAAHVTAVDKAARRICERFARLTAPAVPPIDWKAAAQADRAAVEDAAKWRTHVATAPAAGEVDHIDGLRRIMGAMTDRQAARFAFGVYRQLDRSSADAMLKRADFVHVGKDGGFVAPAPAVDAGRLVEAYDRELTDAVARGDAPPMSESAMRRALATVGAGLTVAPVVWSESYPAESSATMGRLTLQATDGAWSIVAPDVDGSVALLASQLVGKRGSREANKAAAVRFAASINGATVAPPAPTPTAEPVAWGAEDVSRHLDGGAVERDERWPCQPGCVVDSADANDATVLTEAMLAEAWRAVADTPAPDGDDNDAFDADTTRRLFAALTRNGPVAPPVAPEAEPPAVPREVVTVEEIVAAWDSIACNAPTSSLPSDAVRAAVERFVGSVIAGGG